MPLKSLDAFDHGARAYALLAAIVGLATSVWGVVYLSSRNFAGVYLLGAGGLVFALFGRDVVRGAAPRRARPVVLGTIFVCVGLIFLAGWALSPRGGASGVVAVGSGAICMSWGLVMVLKHR
jgi:hypothetical protein